MQIRFVTLGLVIGAITPLATAADHRWTSGDHGVALQPFSTSGTTNNAAPPNPAGPDGGSRVQSAFVAPREVATASATERVTQRSAGKGPIINGSSALLRGGIAYAPAQAPADVKSAIWAANALHRKPYRWGGGHRSFEDRGYDCSGAVSFALHHGGLLGAPLPSSDFQRFGERGRGRWITIYSRRGHTFAVIAGLRFDTTDMRDGGDVGPRWYAEARDTRGFEARHPVGL